MPVSFSKNDRIFIRNLVRRTTEPLKKKIAGLEKRVRELEETNKNRSKKAKSLLKKFKEEIG